MNKNYILKPFCFFITLALAIVLFVFGIWYIAIPETFIIEKIHNSIHKPYRVEFKDFKKGLFFKVTANNVKLFKTETELVSIDSLTVGFKPLSLVEKKVKIFVEGIIYGGYFRVMAVLYNFSTKNYELNGLFKQIAIENIGYLKDLDVKGSGLLSGAFDYKHPAANGQVWFEISPFSFHDYSKGRVYLPLQYFSKIQGAVDIVDNNKLSIKSLTASGDGVFARLKGNATFNELRLTIELMPEENFKGKDKLLLLKHYEKSPGYYLININQRLRQNH